MKGKKLVMPLSFLLLYIFTLNISLLPILFSKHSFFSHWFLRYKNSNKTEYRVFDCIDNLIMDLNRFFLLICNHVVFRSIYVSHSILFLINLKITNVNLVILIEISFSIIIVPTMPLEA